MSANDFTLRRLPSEKMLRQRYRLRPYLERLSKADADGTPASCFEEQVALGLADVFEIISGNDETKGLMLLEVLEFPDGHRDVNILGLSTSSWEEDKKSFARAWREILPQVEVYAKKHGCSGIRGTTNRPGAWARLIKDPSRAWKRHEVTHRVEIPGAMEGSEPAQAVG